MLHLGGDAVAGGGGAAVGVQGTEAAEEAMATWDPLMEGFPDEDAPLGEILL